jgi:hypothetical protein
MPVQEPASTGDKEPAKGHWVGAVVTPLLAALLGAAVGIGGGVYVADRQSNASREDVARQIAAARVGVARQIAAARVGRISDVRAETYGDFVSAVDRHLEKVGEGSENAIRQADEEVVAALRLVDLRGSPAAFVEADAISLRARKLTTAALVAVQTGRGDRVPKASAWGGSRTRCPRATSRSSARQSNRDTPPI